MAWTERYVRADAAGGGDGTTDTNSGANGAWTVAEAISNVAAGHRVNVRQGAYSVGGTTAATAGTTTAPIWWRGFNTTPGDLESDNSLTKPAVSISAGNVWTWSGAHQIVSGIEFSGSRAGATILRASGAHLQFVRCKFTNTSSTNNSYSADSATGDYHVFLLCHFNSPNITSGASYNTDRKCEFHGCVFEGGANGLQFSGANVASLLLTGCIFDNLGGDGLLMSSSNHGGVKVLNCTFYSCAGDGIEINNVSGGRIVVGNCIFSENGGYGNNQSSGANTNVVTRFNNLFHNNTSGTETGFGDSPSLYELSDSSSPFEDAPNNDFTPVSTSNAIAGGLPGEFEGL